MSALQKIREWLSTFPGNDRLRSLKVDYFSADPNNGNISPSGLIEVSRTEDILGNQTVNNQYNFGLYYVLAKAAGDDEVLKEKCTVTINLVKDAPPPERKQTAASVRPENPELFELLRECRAVLAAKERVPAYIIFTDAALRDMCEKLPTSEMAFLSVSGVGRAKLEKYGETFMRCIRSYLKKQALSPAT